MGSPKSISGEEAAYRAWVVAKKSNDPWELSKAESRLFKKLTLYAKKILSHQFDRDEKQELHDVASMAAAQGMARASTFRGQSKFTSWFYTIARQAGYRYFSSPQKRASKLGVQLEEETLVGDLSDVESQIYISQLRKLLEPEEQFLLDAKLAGLSEREICEEFSWYFTSHEDNGAKNRWGLLKMTLRERLAGASSPQLQ